MKRVFLKELVILFGLVAVGCAPLLRPERTNVINVQVVDKPFDAAWDELIEHLTSRQIQLRTLNKDSGFVDTAFMMIPSATLADYAWTGDRAPSPVTHKGRISLNIFVKKLSDTRTRITVNSRVEVFDEYVSRYRRGGWREAKSTGKIEAEILGSVRLGSVR